ncbi:MAG: UDP-N-acetylglucosamine 4,6-dehydratase (inverting) [Opitutales bacterium]
MFDGKSILVTGGTGSFGRQFVQQVLVHHQPSRLIVYSRDEFKQAEMQADPAFQDASLRFFLGDVRDRERLNRAMQGVDIVVHAAALKQVPAAEYNPHEFIKTNINGAINVVECALDNHVDRVLALSTDKAVNPINLYGATKLCSDKIFIAANSYRGRKGTKLSVVRYGNVLGSRGSVIPRFLAQRASGIITVTDPDMTRFFLPVERGAEFVLQALRSMKGGELYVPKIASCRLGDLVEAVAPDCTVKIVGLRPGEKMHEVLIPQDEARLTREYPDHFVVQPLLPFWDHVKLNGISRPVDATFCYSSDTNDDWFDLPELRRICRRVEAELNRSQGTVPCAEGSRPVGRLTQSGIPNLVS